MVKIICRFYQFFFSIGLFSISPAAIAQPHIYAFGLNSEIDNILAVNLIGVEQILIRSLCGWNGNCSHTFTISSLRIFEWQQLCWTWFCFYPNTHQNGKFIKCRLQVDCMPYEQQNKTCKKKIGILLWNFHLFSPVCYRHHYRVGVYLDSFIIYSAIESWYCTICVRVFFLFITSLFLSVMCILTIISMWTTEAHPFPTFISLRNNALCRFMCVFATRTRGQCKRVGRIVPAPNCCNA